VNLVLDRIESRHDREFTFDPESHQYTYGGIKFDSVTQFLGRFKRGFDEEYHAQRFAKKHNTTAQKVKEDWDLKRVAGTDLGNKVHPQAELWAGSYCAANFNARDPAHTGLVQCDGLRRFFHDHSELRYMDNAAEVQIVDPVHRLAGTIDLLYLYFGSNGIIYDWKSNKKLDMAGFKRMRYPLNQLDDCNFIHYALQLNLYDRILRDHYHIQSSSRKIVWLDRQGGYEIIAVPLMDGFIDKLLKYRRNRIKERPCDE